jgi:hypothetical protein
MHSAHACMVRALSGRERRCEPRVPLTSQACCSPHADRHLEDGDDLASDSVARALRVSRGTSASKPETSRETPDVNTSLSAVLDRTIDSATGINVAGGDDDKIAYLALDESHMLKSFLSQTF